MPRSRAAFSNHTDTDQTSLFSFLPHASLISEKRSLACSGETHHRKRAKIRHGVAANEDEDKFESSCESEDDNGAPSGSCLPHTISGWRRKPQESLWMNMRALSTGAKTRVHLSYLPIIKSLVSSNKSDVFKSTSVFDDNDLSTPYACSYSYGAKRGGKPFLAVATEEGSLHIIDTSKRDDWDVEPPRTTIHPHGNAIFGLKWSPSDSRIATASADHTANVIDPQTKRTLATCLFHTGTVRCLAWDSQHGDDVLCTGGRDGEIRLWDIRVPSRYSGMPKGAVESVMVIPFAHHAAQPKTRTKKGCSGPAISVTSLIYAENEPHQVISSGSFDSVLRQWDLRLPKASTTRSGGMLKRARPKPILSSYDPSISGVGANARHRGLANLVAGIGPTSSLVFALAADTRIHTYDMESLSPIQTNGQSVMQSNTFYTGLAISPCGHFLACGSPQGKATVFDISMAGRTGPPGSFANKKVELHGQGGEVGALDWAEGTLATCADDRTVRIWRLDVERQKQCENDPEEEKWGWSWAHTS